MNKEFNLQLDLNLIDYLFFSPDEYKNDLLFVDPNKLLYNEEQIFEKKIKKQLEYLPIERYQYLFKNLDEDTTYILTFN